MTRSAFLCQQPNILTVALTALGAALSGCAVGPDYRRPSALQTQPLPANFTGAATTNAGDWKPDQPAAHLPRGAWWKLFDDTELNHLEQSAASGKAGGLN